MFLLTVFFDVPFFRGMIDCLQVVDVHAHHLPEAILVMTIRGPKQSEVISEPDTRHVTVNMEATVTSADGDEL